LILLAGMTFSKQSQPFRGYTQSSRTTKSLWYLFPVACVFAIDCSGQASTSGILAFSDGQSAFNLGVHLSTSSLFVVACSAGILAFSDGQSAFNLGAHILFCWAASQLFRDSASLCAAGSCLLFVVVILAVASWQALVNHHLGAMLGTASLALAGTLSTSVMALELHSDEFPPSTSNLGHGLFVSGVHLTGGLLLSDVAHHHLAVGILAILLGAVANEIHFNDDLLPESLHYQLAWACTSRPSILLKAALNGRSSMLFPDKMAFGYGFLCGGPGRGGTCDISAWDGFYLAVFWMLNTIGWVNITVYLRPAS
jgi:Photosystem I psaA/psaB protein